MLSCYRWTDHWDTCRQSNLGGHGIGHCNPLVAWHDLSKSYKLWKMLFSTHPEVLPSLVYMCWRDQFLSNTSLRLCPSGSDIDQEREWHPRQCCHSSSGNLWPSIACQSSLEYIALGQPVGHSSSSTIQHWCIVIFCPTAAASMHLGTWASGTSTAFPHWWVESCGSPPTRV